MMKESGDPGERRQYPRIRKDCMALCINTESGIERKTIAVGRVLDIGPGGLKVEVDTVVRVGTDMRMRLTLRHRALEVAGRVVYCAEGDERRQILGIEFYEPIKDFCIEA